MGGPTLATGRRTWCKPKDEGNSVHVDSSHLFGERHRNVTKQGGCNLQKQENRRMFISNMFHLFDQGRCFSDWNKLNTYALTFKGHLKSERDQEPTHDHLGTTELKDTDPGRITPTPGCRKNPQMIPEPRLVLRGALACLWAAPD